jgi:rsbT co-antagonist protein RsbR
MALTASFENTDGNGAPVTGPDKALREELVTHAHAERAQLRTEWLGHMAAAGFLKGTTAEETDFESATLYDACVECLQNDRYQAAQNYAERMAKRAVRGAEDPQRILVGMMTLRDVRVRSIIRHYGTDPDQLLRALDIYEPVANRILLILAMAFLAERERVMAQHQEAMRELSTPVLRVRDRLLILPIIGLLDSDRARRLTEQLLLGIREFRARVVVMDVTGVAAVDSKVANHLMQTVAAARLLGATVIVTGVSPAIAQTIVTIGVDLSRIQTVCDLQGGLELADRILGDVATSDREGAEPAGLLGTR